MSLESIKQDSLHLRGTLVGELADDSASFGSDNAQILKFHGIYQQDDRDLRRRVDREYVFMVRAALPGGAVSAEQYLVADELADWVGDGSLRITSRQGLQWHQIRKGSIKALVWTLNQSLVTTFGACGDVVRNVVACPAPSPERERIGLDRWARRVAEHFRPRTSNYWEIWIDGQRTVTAGPTDPVEPIYGDTYLPRKFKIGFAYPGDNCVDVYTNDVGVIPVIDHDGGLEGFTLLAGGGQGRSHNRPDTFPRLGDPFATVPPDQLLETLEAMVVVQRDHGDRNNRKQARLKYLIDRLGPSWFLAAVEDTLGRRLDPPQELSWTSNADHLGWHRQSNGTWFLGISVENGRIKDGEDVQLRSGLWTLIDRYRPGVRFTPQQNLLLTGLAVQDRDDIDRLLADHGVVPASRVPLVIRNAMACVALPTCGLALTDAERSLPDVVRQIHTELAALGLDLQAIHVRMTGCPNGCARPYSTEIGLVGRRKDKYDIHLGGAADGTRLNELFFELVPADRIAATLRPLFAAYAQEREPGESFGDYTHRLGLAGVKRRFADPALVAEVAR